MNSSNDRKIIFTRDAKLTVVPPKAAEFAAGDAAGTAPAPDSVGTLKGYAIVWNVLSSDRGGYKVRLLPGSARFTSPTHALYHHEFAGGPLGDTATNSLRVLPPDDYGVPVEIDLPNTTNGRDTYELVRTGRIGGMSFAMVTTPTAQQATEGGEAVLNVTDFLCDEVTVTAIPAFTQTSIGVKEDGDGGEAPEPMALSAKENSADTMKERTRQSLKLQELKLSMYDLE